MASFMSRYREAVTLHHAWETPLTCPSCGTTAVPVMKGWTPSLEMRFGDRATIYANLSCPKCAADLRETASAALPPMFSGIELPAAIRRTLWTFLVVFMGGGLLLVGLLAWGVRSGWWTGRAFTALSFSVVLIAPLIMFMNYRLAQVRNRCECGHPAYKFMGMLGRSYCFRCSSCGRLLRTRD
jgi:hypothetical protein